MDSYTVNRFMVDYLTLTSFDDRDAREFVEFRERIGSRERREVGVMQYRGEFTVTETGTVFVGEGVQRGKPHHMIRVSGELADTAVRYLLGVVSPSATCTRIDYQITRDMGEDDTRWVAETRYLLGEVARGGRGVRLVEGGGGMDTLYIGSRKSERFMRFYTKWRDAGSQGLRAEVEVKGGRAAVEWSWLLAGKHVEESAMTAISTVAPDEVSRLMGIGRGEKRPYTVKKSDGKEKWIMETVLPSLVSMVVNGEEGHRELARYVEKVLSSAIETSAGLDGSGTV